MNIFKSPNRELVIGSSLQALLYSYYTGSPLIYLRKEIPFEFDCFPPYFDLSEWLENKEPIQQSTTGSTRLVGISKKDLWEKLYFMLSISGLIPFGDKIKTIRFEDDTVRAVCRRAYDIEFDKAVIFSDWQLQGLDGVIEDGEKQHIVYDWFSVKSGAKHEYDFLTVEDGSALKEILFYETKRAFSSTALKDLVAISHMTESELNDYRFSDAYVRIKAQNLMKEAGIKGKRNGRDQANPNKYKYYAIRLEAVEREVETIGFSNSSQNPKINFNSSTPEEIIKVFRGVKPNRYLQDINKCLQIDIST